MKPPSMYCSPGHSASTEPRKVHRMLEDRKRPKLSLLHICPLLPALNVWLESLLKFYEKKKKIQCAEFHFLSCVCLVPCKGLPWWLSGKESPAVKKTEVRSLGQEDSPRGGNGNPLQYSCLANPYRQRTPAGYSPRCRKELDRTKGLNSSTT